MQQGGSILANVLKNLTHMVKPGITGVTLDQEAERMIISSDAIPAFKGYQGYPATLCVSINSQVVHGIPGLDQLLQQGLKIPVYVVEDPLSAVARGTGVILDDLSLYEDVLIGNQDELPPR